PSGDDGGDDFAPGAFLAAVVFPAQTKIDRLAAQFVRKLDAEGAARAENRVRQLMERQRAGAVGDPIG
ncbi:MAG: hypothetical protein LBK99_10390, partial [Opitutaceae bacterium]|nr:hypothetical protein [Opitutaceae bacterium]